MAPSGQNDPRTSLRQERRRDSQQWMLDYLVKVTGREQNFA